ncbi:MAG: hypothetical protein U9Q82_08770 [Chloroflexota bacterium]|nr:hypothetical protein [Chloroflexota bacterium]
MKRLIQVFLGLIAVGIGVAGAWYGRTSYLESVVTVQLPVPKEDIAPYTIISEDLLETREFPRALIEEQVDFAVSAQTLMGNVTTSILAAGLPIPSQLVQPAEEFRLAAPSLEVVSLPVSPEYAVGGKIEIGEWVNVYLLSVLEDDQIAKDDQELDADDVVTPKRKNTYIDLVATVPVVDVLSQDGTADATADANQGEKAVALQILVLAAPPEIVEDILAAQAVTTAGDHQIWITLATLEE